MKKLPVKFRVFQIIAECDDISNREIYERLKEEYPLDRHVTPQGVDNYLMSLKAVGLIKNTAAFLSDERTILEKYRLAEDGLNKLKYI